MYQNVSLIGNLGRDPELRRTQNGTAVCTLSVAVTEKWKNAQGQPQERTVWFRVNCWKGLAETAAKYLSKGRQVFVEGTLSEPKPYQARDGEWRASLDVTAKTIKFLGGGNGNHAPAEPEDAYEEELPF